MKRYSIKSKILICIALILVVIANFFSLAKYRSVLSSYSSGNVAKWYNDLTIDVDQIIFDNNSSNNSSFNFNVLSNSEVSSKYNVGINGLHRYIDTTINNSNNEVGVYVNSDTIKVKIGKEVAKFSIPIQSTTLTERNITMTANVTRDTIYFNFSIRKVSLSLDVTLGIGSDYYDILINNMGEFEIGNQIERHTVSFVTDTFQMPGSISLDIYAYFEQID